MKLMNIKEASDYLQLHEMTVYRLIKAGKLPAKKVGGHRS